MGDVALRLGLSHDHDGCAFDLVRFIGDSFECQFSLFKLRSYCRSEYHYAHEQTFVLTTKAIEEFGPFVSGNLFRLHN